MTGVFCALTVFMILTVAVITCGAAAYAAQEEIQGEDIQESKRAVSESGISGRVRSSGRVQYEYVVIDGDDLRWIDAYISEKKDAAARALIQLGTRFRQQPGQYAYDRNPDAGQEDIDLSGLGWATLIQAAKESQSVPAGLPVLNPEAALYIEGVEERTDFYEAATEDNLSAGKAAWVDGRLILGNGADNDRAYRQGITDGRQGKIPGNLHPLYNVQKVDVEIRHEHIGKPEEKEGTSGCYYNHAETQSQVTICDSVLVYHDPVWYPDASNPEGGEWHGGGYACPVHGGIYLSPGICGYEQVISTTTWNHSISCGQENMLYARLTLKASDTKQMSDMGQSEGQICLSAVLEEGAGYKSLIWQKGDKLVWTDKRGNVLGTGTDLMVSEPGIYRCSLNVANTDINRKMAEVVVRVSGLMMTGN